jgi:hypothetical protein
VGDNVPVNVTIGQADFNVAASEAEVAVAQGNVSTQWWLFPPFGGPNFKTNAILYNPNPLTVTRSGTYAVSVFFQRPGLQRISVVSANRNGRLVVRQLFVKVGASW